MPSQGAPSGAALFRCVATCRNSVSLISVLLPEPETPVTQVSRPERDLDVEALQVVAARADDAQRAIPLRGRAQRGQRDLATTRQVLARERVRVVDHFLRRARGHQLAAVHAGAGAEVDHVVGGADRILVVLDDDHRVADVAQAAQRAEQPLVVALVQADRRFVEDVHDAGEAGADLAREPDALRFAARERVGAAIERQVVEPDVDQEAQPVANFLDDARGDLAAPAGDGELAEERERARHREARDRRQRLLADEHVPRRAVQARAVAVRAGAQAEVLGELLAHRRRFGLAVPPLEVRQDALEAMLAARELAAGFRIAELDLFLAAAVEQQLPHFFGQLVPGLLDVEAEVLRERLDHVEVMRIAPVPAAHGAARERQVRMRDDARRIEELLVAEAVAGGACAGRVVEGEHLRLEQRHAVAALGAGVAVREQQLGLRARRGLGGSCCCAGVGGVGEREARSAAGEPQRGLERFGEPLARIGPDAQPVHHGLDAVLAFRVELRRGVDLADAAIDAHTHEALRLQLLEHLGVLALAVRDHRSEQQRGAALGQLQHLVHHLADRLRRELDAMLGAARDAGARIQQAQVVVDLGDGADGRARVVRGRLLLDGDRGREALDRIHVGLVHHGEELARVRRQRLDVAALALGVQGVEGERGLARARQARDHDQPVARDVEVEVAQVVRARPADPDELHAPGVRMEQPVSVAVWRGAAKTGRSRPIFGHAAGRAGA